MNQLTGSCHRRPLGGSRDPAIMKADTEEEETRISVSWCRDLVVVSFGCFLETCEFRVVFFF